MTFTADLQGLSSHTSRSHSVAATRGVAATLYAIAIAIAALVLAVSVWGPVALTVTAMALVPLMFVLLIAIGWPRT